MRGLILDENNQNPDVIEWVEFFDVDDLQRDGAPYPYKEQCVRLTPEQKVLARQVGEPLGAAVATG